MRILALDPSVSSTGYAVMELIDDTVYLIDYYKITTSNKHKSMTRMKMITDSIEELVKKYGIETIILEGTHIGRNPKSSILLARLRGHIEYMISDNQLQSYSYQPSSIRSALMGKGNSSKEAVALFLQEQYDFKDYMYPFSDKSNKQKNSDIYDAILIGLAYIMKKDIMKESE